jgi:hypothetical protein
MPGTFQAAATPCAREHNRDRQGRTSHRNLASKPQNQRQLNARKTIATSEKMGLIEKTATL